MHLIFICYILGFSIAQTRGHEPTQETRRGRKESKDEGHSERKGLPE